MRQLLTVPAVLFALVACNNPALVTNDNKPQENSSDKKKIKKIFSGWQAAEIKAGHFLPGDSCNPEWFAKHTVDQNLDSRDGLIYGFPADSTEYTFSFADLNGYSKLDGLICFTPDQCDGGNASMWTQWQVFIFSDKENYSVTDTLQVDKFSSTDFDSSGFYWLDSIRTNKIFGTYIQFTDSDGHCCPGINKPVAFDFMKRKLIFIGENIERK